MIVILISPTAFVLAPAPLALPLLLLLLTLRLALTLLLRRALSLTPPGALDPDARSCMLAVPPSLHVSLSDWMMARITAALRPILAPAPKGYV